MFCNHCGKANPDDARVCAYCGAVLVGGVAERRLVRPREGRRIAGVCAGVSQYYGWKRDYDSAAVVAAVPVCRNRRAAVPHSLDCHAE